MAVKKNKQEVFNAALLKYFNEVLLEKKVITEQSYQAMSKKIAELHA